MAPGDEKKFRKDIAEIIKSVKPKLDADNIASSMQLKDINFSKIDLQDTDVKSALVKIIMKSDSSSILRFDLSTELSAISDRATKLTTEHAQKSSPDIYSAIRNLDELAHSQANTEKKFRKDIAEIIRGARAELNADADNIANEVILVDVDFSKIDLQDKDIKSTLVEIITGSDRPLLLPLNLSLELKEISNRAIDIDSTTERSFDKFARSQANSPPKQSNITSPFADDMEVSDMAPTEKEFRKGIAEIIRGAHAELNADDIANSIDLKGVNLSKIDLQDKDIKSTLVEIITESERPLFLPLDLSFELKEISNRAIDIDSTTERSFDKFARSQANRPPKQSNITSPFGDDMEVSDMAPTEKEFRKDIAEIIIGARAGFNADAADYIANEVNLIGTDFSKIDLQDKDIKSTLVKIIKHSFFLQSDLSTQLLVISDRATKLTTEHAQESSPKAVGSQTSGPTKTSPKGYPYPGPTPRIGSEVKRSFDELARSQDANPPIITNPFNPDYAGISDNEDDMSVSSDDSGISISSNLSYKDIYKGVKQSELIPEAIKRMAGLADHLPKNIRNPNVKSAAVEISDVLRKGGEDELKLATIINQSDRVDLYKACEKLYEDIENDIQFPDIIDSEQQANLEIKILEKLPKRIEEAKSERTFNFERLKGVTEKLVTGKNFTPGGRVAFLKEEFGKMDRAGKALAVGAVAAAALVLPAVLGVGLAASASAAAVGVATGAAGVAAGAVAAPFVAASRAKKAYDKRVEDKRQKSADTKKGVVPRYVREHLTKLSEELIDLAVFDEKVKMLEVAIKQDPELKDKISQKEFKLIKDYITAKEGKLEKMGEFQKTVEGLNGDVAKNLLKLVRDIKQPHENLNGGEQRYFDALKKVITTGLSTHIKSAFSNKVITTGSNANRVSVQRYGRGKKIIDRIYQSSNNTKC